MTLPHDPLWPRAGNWPAWPDSEAQAGAQHPDAAIIGVPTHATSLSPTGAHATPAAIRQALQRFSPTLMGPPAIDLRDHITVADAGDIHDPDTAEGIERTVEAVRSLSHSVRRVIALGGDNSLTYPVARGAGARGLITFDAHFDLRDGVSNGSPVRRLIDDAPTGERIDPHRIVQIGVADYANSAAYAERAAGYGIRVVTLDEFRARGIADVATEALRIAGGEPVITGAGVQDAGELPDAGGVPDAGGLPDAADSRIHLDIDVDVCDRSVAPGCPASVPGGLHAWELRSLTRAIAHDPRVVSADIAEVDATADTPDGRTVRLAALCVLELLAGMVR
ncbi:arginase family protein [Microbacterium sp. YY-01]|uniref:arginase family protein n=1 Tax=Microbacterium sp. YY-01 TaxID=3421634 RepID=UPI003D180B85